MKMKLPIADTKKKINNAFTKWKPRPQEIHYSLLLSEGKDQNYLSGLKAM